MLVELLLDAARRRSRVIAVSDPVATLNYRRLRAFARVIRDEITRRTQAERVGLLLPASGAFSGCLFGTLWARRVAVPLNFLLSPAELARLVRVAGLDTVFTIRHFAELAGALPATTVFLEDLNMKRRIFGALLRSTPPPPTVDPDDTAVLLFTSGTSAEPKGVELTQRNLTSNCRDCIETAHMQPDHNFLNCLPPFHIFGLLANVIAPVALGASVYCVPRFQPAAVARAVQEHKISILMAIPSMYRALLRLKPEFDGCMRSVYLAVSGGEPLPDAVFDEFRDRFGVELLQGYGLTETSPVCMLEIPEARKRGSIGRPVKNVLARIVDPAGRDVPVGAEGEIWVKGPNVMKGYFQRPDDTRAAITPDGWFRTGDGGCVDADGFITITGRLKELIIIGGENVHPREIEDVLEQHPAVAEAAVIGVPDASRGEVAVAYVIPLPDATVTELELRTLARQHLAGYKVPRQIHIVQDLPRSPIGKVLKRKLRAPQGEA
ncbi:MAG TPA: AMP-binding protein [Phycisphaerae bacterium]|nr:AMP-binding protein [Phycisphaerales bacterium]HRX83637.1 AMP-binding protein [Phycisphaerae bacterium]